MLCLSCRRVGEEGETDTCARCGAGLVAVSSAHLEALISAEVSERLRQSREQEDSSRVSSAVVASAGVVVAAIVAVPDRDRRAEDFAAREEAARLRQARMEQRTALEKERLDAYLRSEQERVAANLARRERAKHTRDAEASVASDAAEAMARDEAGAAHLVASLDDHKDGADATFRSVLYENIGWFIGAMLVLSGSVYGVREAWLAFGEVGRYFTVGVAFFAYHTMFIGLGALLASRARTASRVVSGIGLGLLPIVAAVFANLIRVNAGLGATVGAGFLAASAVTSFLAGRRLAPAAPWLLPAVIVPALLAELPLEALDDTSVWRAWLPLLALLGPVVVGRGSPKTALRLDPLIIALYCVVAVQIFALVSGQTGADAGGDVVWRTGGARYSGSLSLYFAAIGAVLMDLGAQARWRMLAPKLFGALGFVGLSIAMMATVQVATTVVFADLNNVLGRDVALLATLTAAISAACALSLQTAFTGAAYAVWFAASVACAAAARTLLPGIDPAWWMVSAAIPSTAFLVAGPRDGLVRLSGLSLVGLFISAMTMRSPDGGLVRWSPGLLIGVAYVAAAHYRGKMAQWWHYSAAVAVGVVWAIVLTQLGIADTQGSTIFTMQWASGLVLCSAYAAASWFGEDKQARLRPLADISLLFILALLASLLPAFASPESVTTTMQGQLALVLVALFARGLLDHSAAVSVVALLIAEFFASQLFQVGDGPPLGRYFAASAVALSLLAAVAAVRLQRDDVTVPRHLFGKIRLPLGARRRTLVVDAFAAAGLLSLLAALLSVVAFLSNVQEADRSFAIAAAGSGIVVLLIAFLTASHERFDWRGQEATLWAAAALIALTAITNRIGRPLPPHVVGRNLTIIAIAVWGVAVLAFRHGPKLGEWLGHKAEGYRYHRVPHAGVIALGLLLLFDALSIGSPTLLRAFVVTPPTFILGPAIICFLLTRSLRVPLLLVGFFALLIPFAGLVMSEHSLLGPVLAPLLPPGGQWVSELGAGDWLDTSRYVTTTERAVYQSFQLGCVLMVALLVALSIAARFSATFGTVFTRLVFGQSNLVDADGARTVLIAGLQILSAIALVVLLGAAGVVSSPVVASLGALAMVAMVIRPIDRPFYALAPLAAPWIIHAFAQLPERFPVWTGPSLVGASAVLIGVASWRVGMHKKRQLALVLTSLVLLLSFPVGWLYALATRGLPDRAFEVMGVLNAIGSADETGPWWTTAAIPLTFAIFVLGCVISAYSFSKKADPLGGVATAIALVFAGFTAHAAQLAVRAPLLFSTESTWGLAVCSSLVTSMALATVVAVMVRTVYEKSHDEIAMGGKWARDAMLLMVLVTSTVLAVSYRSDTDWPAFVLWPTLLAVSTCTLVALVTALRRLTPFHMYVAQSSLLVTYAVVRAGLAQSLRPEHDALFMLVLGFLLVGAVVVARRAKVPPIASAIKHFIVALPLLMAVVLPWQASVEGAALAAGSGLLYAAVGWVEDNRWFGALGAAAANVGLLVFALSQGMDGIEVYFVPLGLVCLICVHIFADELESQVRQTLRFIGSGFVYVPSAFSIAFQVGNAADAMYPLMFAGACMIGIALGMILHIRAYLFLGTLFLTLDVIANLVRASLRDQRLGFFVLSASGLAILGGMVAYTLNKEKAHAWWSRYMKRLRKWD